MASKTTKVALHLPENNHTEEFEIAHAERILRLKNNGGWQLPENSKYQFDEENGITKRDTK